MEPQTPSKFKNSIFRCFHSHRIVNFCLIVLAILLILAGIFYGYALFGKDKTFFTVVVDCGSTGTRVNVYEYEWKHNAEKIGDLPILLNYYPHEANNQINGCGYHCMQTKPGLDKFVGNYLGVRASLVPLLTWAERIIPNARHGVTPILILATAGLRRVGMEDCRRVLEDVERVVEGLSFKWRRDWIRVLSGVEEAYYGWVALNYKMGNLNSRGLPTLGLLDLGGSSLQVVVEADKVKDDDRNVLVSKIGVVEHKLMAYSLPAFGLNEAFDTTVGMLMQVNYDGSHVRHPCLSSKFIGNYSCSCCYESESLLTLVGNPNWEKCKILAQATAMNISISGWSDPRLNSSCHERSPNEGKNILNVAINTKRDVRYHALSGFFAVYNMLNLTAKANLTNVWEAGQHLCSSIWDNESNISGSHYCLKVLYLASLIQDGLCLENADIIFGPGDISWTLGASLVEGRIWRTTNGPKTSTLNPQYMEVVSSPFFLFIILVVLVFIVYHSQIKLPMPRKRSSAVGAPLPSSSYMHAKH